MEVVYFALLILSSGWGVFTKFEMTYYPCTTPNDEVGVCISLFSCPILMRSLGTLQPSAVIFVRNSICCNYSPGDLKVCCGTHGNYLGLEVESSSPPASTTTTIPVTPETEKTTESSTTGNTLFTSPLIESSTTTNDALNLEKETKRDFAKKELLPSIKYCGLQHTDDRFYTANSTALDEFPWLVHVIFLDDADEDPFQYLDRCNGVLINNRYVLTTGICASQVPAIRLGQHNVNKTISCLDNPELPECTDPRYDVLVEAEMHRAKSNDTIHDFALLRLAKPVTFTDYVRPICLPLPEYRRPNKIESLVFSGWGATSQEIAAIKKRLTYKIADGIDECLKIDESDLRNFTANNTILCLTPDEGNTELACTGDEGGPLMYSHRHQWFVEGIITAVYDGYQERKVTGVFKNDSVEKCSNRLPVSGIKITSEVLDWILDTIRL